MLLETFRKCITKVYTTRLERIIRVNNILEGSNFAGLIGSSTESLIHILSMIIEEAKEKNKELWIMLQDMKKAFDSVNLDLLKLTLQRIKIPVLGQSFILDLFDKRQTRIITALGLTEAITAGDGIEQGEVISPLIWRIFYDPLLTKIKKSARLGYEMEVSWQEDLTRKRRRSQKIRQAVVTFADDTTWIASSKKQLEETIKVAEEFFKFNDIQINPSKSKLIAINTRTSVEERKVIVDKQEVYATKEKEVVRFLGTWIGQKVGKKQIVAKAKQIARLFANTIKKKIVSTSQVLYINNVCLMPRLEYILQSIILTKDECEKIQQPYTMIAKNKIGLARTIPNYIMSHSGILSMRMLWNALKTKQTLSLINRLNKNCEVKDITEIRIRQGQQITCCTNSIWTEKLDEMEIKLLKDNLAG